jgi:integrase
MPRLTNGIPKYRKHRATGQALVTLSGRDHYLGPHGTRVSKREYDRLIAEWLERGRQPAVTIDDGLTVVEAIARYWQHARGYYVKHGRATGEQDGIRSALRFLKELYGNRSAAEYSPLGLKAVRSRMLEAGLARSTVNQHVGRIRRMFKWLASEQLLPAYVWQSLVVVDGLRKGRTTAREPEPVRPVAGDVVEATLPNLPEVVADMVRLQKLTAMRPAEVCGLRPCDLERGGEVWLYRVGGHKTEHHGRERVVCIGPQAQAVLLRYLARDSETCCFRPCDSEAKRRAAAHAARKTPLSCGTKPGDRRKTGTAARTPGDRYSTDSYRRAIERACDLAFPAPDDITEDPGLLRQWRREHRWRPNQLRHSAASEIRRRFGLEAAQTVLGHSKADTTQIYAQRDCDLAVRVAKEVG